MCHHIWLQRKTSTNWVKRVFESWKCAYK